MPGLPIYIPLAFVLTTGICFLMLLWTVLLAFAPTRRGQGMELVMAIFILLCIWLTLQAWLAAFHFYAETESIPPRLAWAVLPILTVIAGVFITSWRRYLDKLPLLPMTLIHTIRIPVELCLWWLYQQEQVPVIMTFEGWNYDIVAGISAPLVAYFTLIRNRFSHRVLLGWNLICLVLLLNIVGIAVLSVSSPIQMLAYDQPNEAVKYFPFIWLPSFVVPVVFFCHLASIRLLLHELGIRRKPQTAAA